MDDTGQMALVSLCTGVATAAAAWFGRGQFAASVDFVERDLTDKLRRLRVSTRGLRTYLVLWVVFIAGCFFGLWIGMRSLVLGVTLVAILSCGPWYFVRRLAERRRQKIEDQLADSMVMLANAVRSGVSLPQAMQILADECPRPINAEFQQIVNEYNLGKPLADTLTEARERLKSENFALFAAAVMASHESGGKLNETVERIAKSVLELQRLERKVRSETAQARKSALYMALAPLIILVVYYFVDPVNTTMLFTQTAGHILLAIALVLNVVAYLWARVILNPEI